MEPRFSEKHWALVSLDRIGYAVARRTKGFNMTILYYDLVRNNNLEESLRITHVPLENLLSQADIVTVHTPLTEKTKGLIGEKEFKKIKKNAIFVNTSRGPIVDEAALYKALKEEWIAAAGIDVFKKEPLNLDSPLLTLEHSSYTSHHSLNRGIQV